jgi:hypothetical protein
MKVNSVLTFRCSAEGSALVCVDTTRARGGQDVVSDGARVFRRRPNIHAPYHPEVGLQRISDECAKTNSA